MLNRVLDACSHYAISLVGILIIQRAPTLTASMAAPRVYPFVTENAMLAMYPPMTVGTREGIYIINTPAAVYTKFVKVVVLDNRAKGAFSRRILGPLPAGWG